MPKGSQRAWRCTPLRSPDRHDHHRPSVPETGERRRRQRCQAAPHTAHEPGGRVGQLRGAGVSVDGRRVGQVALGIVLVTLAVLAIVFTIVGIHTNQQDDRLHHDGVPRHVHGDGVPGASRRQRQQRGRDTPAVVATPSTGSTSPACSFRATRSTGPAPPWRPSPCPAILRWSHRRPSSPPSIRRRVRSCCRRCWRPSCFCSWRCSCCCAPTPRERAGEGVGCGWRRRRHVDAAVRPHRAGTGGPQRSGAVQEGGV